MSPGAHPRAKATARRGGDRTRGRRGRPTRRDRRGRGFVPPRPAATGTRGPALDLSRLALGARGGAGGRGGGFEPGSRASYPSPPALARGPAAPASRPCARQRTREGTRARDGRLARAALMRRLHGPEDAYRSARERNAGSARAVGDLGQLGFPEYFFPSEKRSERAPGGSRAPSAHSASGGASRKGRIPREETSNPHPTFSAASRSSRRSRRRRSRAASRARRSARGAARVGVRPGGPRGAR